MQQQQQGSGLFDEMNGVDGVVRPVYESLAQWFSQTPAELLGNRRDEAEAFFRRIGITFVRTRGGPMTEAFARGPLAR